MEHLLKAITRVTDYKGRSSRKEYSWIGIPNLVLGAAWDYCDRAYPDSTVTFVLMIASVVVLPFALAAAVRRLHDINVNGLWVLVAFIPRIEYVFQLMLIGAPTVEPNRFGPSAVTVGPMAAADGDGGRAASTAPVDLDELERLARMRAAGALSEPEFAQLKANSMSRAGVAASDARADARAGASA